MIGFFDDISCISEKNVRLFLKQLSERYYAIRYKKIGYSEDKREIGSILIGKLNDPVLLMGGTHGTEWSSVVCLLRFAHELAKSLDNYDELFGINIHKTIMTRGVVIVPLVNPDGYEIARTNGGTTSRGFRKLHCSESFRYWQANSRGVDINHNFPAGFFKAKRAVESIGITRRSPTKYGGCFPFSARETRNILYLCETSRFRSAYSFHSQGEEIFWNYQGLAPERGRYIANTLATLTGYSLETQQGSALHAGFKDWFIKRYKNPAFTIELGKGKNPLPYKDFEAIYQKVKRAIAVATII